VSGAVGLAGGREGKKQKGKHETRTKRENMKPQNKKGKHETPNKRENMKPQNKRENMKPQNKRENMKPQVMFAIAAINTSPPH